MRKDITLTELEEARLRDALGTLREYYIDGIRNKRWGEWFYVSMKVREKDRHSEKSPEEKCREERMKQLEKSITVFESIIKSFNILISGVDKTIDELDRFSTKPTNKRE